MASYAKPNNIINRVAAGNYSASTNLYRAVTATSDTEVTVCSVAGEKAIGFLNNLPALGAVAEINSIGGGSNAVAGGIVTAGSELAVDINGAVVTAAPGDYVVAIAMQDAAANDIFEVLPVLYVI